jgi:hypothetical protein
MGMLSAELELPMFTVPKLVLARGLADSTVKLCVTAGAAANITPSPDWLAWMIQFPSASSIAVEAETVQMAGVVDVKLTGKFELAVAVNITGAVILIVIAGMTPNVIVWSNRLTVKVCATNEAGA